MVIDLLPSEAAINIEGGSSSVFDDSADTSTKRTLQLDALDGALQKVSESRVVPIVPRKEMLCGEANFIARRRVGSCAGT